MAPQPLNSTNFRFARLVNTGFLVIQAAIATTTLSIFASTAQMSLPAQPEMVAVPVNVQVNPLAEKHLAVSLPDSPTEEQSEVCLYAQGTQLEKVIED